jgi:hypothetical protein
MPQRDPSLLPVHELSAAIQCRRLSPVDLVEAHLARIEAKEPKLQAFVEVYAEDARLAGQAADLAIRSGHAVGPLHGIPIALKDLIEIEGKTVTGGCEAWKSRKAARTATLARRLIAQGMIVLGKTHTVEFAMGGWAPTRASARPGTHGTRPASAPPAARAAALGSRSRRASRHGRSAPTPAARCGSRPPGAASPASRPPSAGSAPMACSR